MASIKETIRAWFALSRPPFHLVGLLPFVLGNELAARTAGKLRWPVAVWGAVGVVCVMLATYYAGEYWDWVENRLSSRSGPSRFAGGSGVIERGLLPRRAALWGSVASLVVAAGIGFLLQFGYKTGPWTIPLGAAGIVGGFFYSARPVRWVSRGFGEVWIAFCYGWLPVAVGYYLQTGTIPPVIHRLAIPIGLTIFNVILLNEFPDYDADREAGKKNLTVRLGRPGAALLYGAAAVLSIAAFYWSSRRGVPGPAVWCYLPVFVFSVFITVMVVLGSWRNRATLEKLCAGNIVVNLATTGAYIMAFWVAR